MAKQVGIIQFNGALGETIGAPSMKGYQVIKKRPVSVTNPNTLKQRTQRTLFSAATATSTGTPLAAIAGLRPMAKTQKCSVRNAFTKTLLKDQAFKFTNGGVPGESTADVTYANVSFSKGGEPFPRFGNLSFDTPGTVDIPVALPSGINTKACNVIVVLYAPDNSEYLVESVPCNDGHVDISSISIEVPTYWLGLKIHVWGYLQNLGDEANSKAYYDAKMYGATVDVRTFESQASYSNTRYIGFGNVG